MIRRIAILGLVAVGLWLLGYWLFAHRLGKPLEGRTTDAIVVLTGGGGRIDRGVELLRNHAARRMLISGVGSVVRPRELAAHYRIEPRLMACCIDLGREAIDTRSNAEETAAWVRAHHYRTVRLVTADWHMPRARLELAHSLGSEVELVGDPVRDPRVRSATLFAEYNKYLVRSVALAFGVR